MQLKDEEQELLRYHAVNVDLHAASLIRDQEAVQVSYRTFKAAYEAVLRSHDLNPADFRVSWDGKELLIERLEAE